MTKHFSRFIIPAYLATGALFAIISVGATICGYEELAGKFGLSLFVIIGVPVLCFFSMIALEKRRFPLVGWTGVITPLCIGFLCLIYIWAKEPILGLFWPYNIIEFKEYDAVLFQSCLYLARAFAKNI